MMAGSRVSILLAQRRREEELKLDEAKKKDQCHAHDERHAGPMMKHESALVFVQRKKGSRVRDT